MVVKSTRLTYQFNAAANILQRDEPAAFTRESDRRTVAFSSRSVVTLRPDL
jgi:hypothetical protein